MNALERKRFIKLAGFLEKLPRKDFNFGEVVRQVGPDCGTVGCAIGWTPRVFPDLAEWTTDEDGIIDGVQMKIGGFGFGCVASQLFGISQVMAIDLFSPSNQKDIHKSLKNCGVKAQPKTVAAMMRQFLSLVDAGEIKLKS